MELERNCIRLVFEASGAAPVERRYANRPVKNACDMAPMEHARFVSAVHLLIVEGQYANRKMARPSGLRCER